MLARLKEIKNTGGIKYLARYVLSSIFSWLQFRFNKKRKFIFDGKEYNYYYTQKEGYWQYRTERVAEIPIFYEIIKSANGKRILEVGNTLAHYYPINHTVVDKYEIADGVINKDIVGFDDGKKYDLMLNISTLEHVGFSPQEPDKPAKVHDALQSMRKLLKTDGMIISSFPVGFNPEVDKRILKNMEDFKFMKRVSIGNKWVQFNPTEEAIRRAKYGFPYPCANIIAIEKGPFALKKRPKRKQ
ncbi:MAG: hypothetical protein HY513_03210 [Candidatus Aenigmarchaeota archaeon]|nr:hypothetical protein [Candidatus Aenigmarchaeota archaeon]